MAMKSYTFDVLIAFSRAEIAMGLAPPEGYIRKRVSHKGTSRADAMRRYEDMQNRPNPKVKGAHPVGRMAVVYGDLVLEDYNIVEDANSGDKFAKSLMADSDKLNKLEGKALVSLARLFGTEIWNEGHSSDGALVCKFSVNSWADVKKANDVISRHHTGGDDAISLDVPYFAALSFRLYPDGVNSVFYSEESRAKGTWDDWLSASA